MVLRDRTRLIVGSVGLGLVLAGMALFVEQMYRAVQTGRFERVPVGVVLDEPTVRENTPATVVRWLQQIISGTGGAQNTVTWLLDDVPLALFLVVIGGVAAWRTLLREPPSSRRR